MSYNEDLDFLCEIYDLNDMHMDIIKESMRITHAYDTIGDPQILTEGLSDIIGKMGDFFKKMAEKVKEFFRKIICRRKGEYPGMPLNRKFIVKVVGAGEKTIDYSGERVNVKM